MVIPVAVFTEITEVLLALASHCTYQKQELARDIDGSFRIQKSSLLSDTSSALILPRQAGVCSPVSAVSAAAAEWTRT